MTFEPELIQINQQKIYFGSFFANANGKICLLLLKLKEARIT
jgi:hypothetical protein